MSLKSRIGLDWFDLAIQAGITGMLMIVASSATTGSGADVLISLVVATSLLVLAWRRARAIRLGMTQGPGELPSERLPEIEHRLAQLESQQGRMLELEERLDFAERLLTQQRERNLDRLPAGPS